MSEMLALCVLKKKFMLSILSSKEQSCKIMFRGVLDTFDVFVLIPMCKSVYVCTHPCLLVHPDE